MQILGIAQQGLTQAQGQVDKTAQRIANVGAQSQTAEDSVSVSDNMVSLLSGKNQFEADLGLVKTADELTRQTLNLLA